MVDEQALRAEARIWARYLLDVEPPAELVARYVAAARVHFDRPAAGVDRALLEFVHSAPRALPLLDGAVALLRPGALLRRKLVVMSAILEASPTFAHRFEPECRGRRAAWSQVVRCGLLGAAKVALGLPIYLALVATAREP